MPTYLTLKQFSTLVPKKNERTLRRWAEASHDSEQPIEWEGTIYQFKKDPGGNWLVVVEK